MPDAALVTDGARRVLYVVDARGTVAARPVELGPLTGSLRVIRRGISATDRVIIDGVQRARPGQPVTPTAGRIQPPANNVRATPAPAAAPSSVALPAGR